MHIRIATRQSELAIWQSNYVRGFLHRIKPELRIELIGMTTKGDQILDKHLSKVGGKSLFTSELETAIEQGDADMAVHSLKDMPAELPKQFCIAAILPRDEPRDVLVSQNGSSLMKLPKGVRVGTSSLRRQSQLLNQRSDLEIIGVRGNVPTRLGKISDGTCDAVVLAGAGLRRLGLFDNRCFNLDLRTFLPAIGQGAIAVECKTSDLELRELLKPLNCRSTERSVLAERMLNKVLGGSCQHAIAAHAEKVGSDLRLTGLVSSPDGRERLLATAIGPVEDYLRLGQQVAQELKADGAEELLEMNSKIR